ncbi:hypothetical protein BC833DRAFT_595763 [Globomyces pollinis-pini]|nr:hypothetical protein BC833DRAFT_595763 [Globomyces pollinis-pini]
MSSKKNVILKGNLIPDEVQIGQGNVLQSQMVLEGQITIGNNNIFEDRVQIMATTGQSIVIGDNNHFHTGCLIYAKSIGSNNDFQPFSVVKSGSIILNNCVINPKCTVEADSKLDNVTLYNNGSLRKTSNLHGLLHAKHLDYLTQVLPKYHELQ